MLVLCYHAVSPTWPARLASTPGQLRAHLRHLHRLGFHGVPFTDAIQGRAGGRAVAITFDDAYASVLRRAKPALDELGWPATVFVPTDFPGSGRLLAWQGIDQWLGTPHEEELEPLTWDELRHLRDEGWEVGSHTSTHPHLPALDDGRLHTELTTSRERCVEELGDCASVAYPYGEVDERVVLATREAGYTCGAALHDGSTTGLLRWPRQGVYRVDGPLRFRVKVSRPARRALSAGLRDHLPRR
jgi:peptidoglycan/xylan/chitin deacetylase (PgdA/CDA1 family)